MKRHNTHNNNNNATACITASHERHHGRSELMIARDTADPEPRVQTAAPLLNLFLSRRVPPTAALIPVRLIARVVPAPAARPSSESAIDCYLPALQHSRRGERSRKHGAQHSSTLQLRFHRAGAHARTCESSRSVRFAYARPEPVLSNHRSCFGESEGE